MPIADSVTLEEGVVIFHRDLVNLYGCHVGAGAVVTHDVAPDAVVAGVPARLLARGTTR